MTIKLIAIDYDGSLIELVDAHYETLNKAIHETAGEEFVISREAQDKTFNGLSTKTKLNKLVKEKGLDPSLVDQINQLKQQYTLEYIESNIVENANLKNDLQKLKSEGYLLYCVSNAMLDTVKLGLIRLGVIELFDHLIGNDNVKRQKPAPDIYLSAFIHAGLDPDECLIIEDSANGRASGIRSKAHLLTVDYPHHTTYEHIKSAILKIDSQCKPISWPASNLKIVLPMSGRGSRFAEKGYKLPKPLVNVNGKPMVQVVVENINVQAEFIFIVQKSHYEEYSLGNFLNLISPGCKIIQVDKVTSGAAASVCLAKEYINNDDHLFVINSDQYIDNWDSFDFFNKMLTSGADGGIITFHRENDKKWSYVKLNDDGFITEVKEKECISNIATIGGYYWNKGSDFIKSAEEMILANDMVNGEHYVAPTFNYMIKDGKKIIKYDICENDFYGIGTPEDLAIYLEKFSK